MKEKKEKKRSLSKAFNRLCYTEDNEFSVARITMVVTFISSLTLLWAGALLSILYSIKLPSEIYNYSIALTGGSILQYGGTKVKNSFKKSKN